MNKQVQIITPTKPFIYQEGPSIGQIKRVGAYCRVSTDSDEQLNSHGQQVEEWTKRITDNPNYQLVKIYSDAGISGTSANHRDGFNEMLMDAREGKLDLIYVKSISRFARNTVLTISTIKELKELGVEVYFDNEHMSTFDPKNEFMFSIMSSMAQEESRHISENVKWTFEKMMREGKVFCNTTRFLGYDKDPETGNLVINPEEAKIVKTIFEMYDNGDGPAKIGRYLTKQGYITAGRKSEWIPSTILGILKNEKYKGDLLLQKTVTVDYLSHKSIKNKGHAQQYYVENNHEPIVSKELWERVRQKIDLQSRRLRGANKDINKYNTRYPLSGMLICNNCGQTYKRRHWTQGYKTPKIMFQCNGYIGDSPRCAAKPLSENVLLIACADVINNIYLTESPVFDKLLKVIEKNLSIKAVEEELHQKEVVRNDLDAQIDILLKERVAATEPAVKLLFDNKYRRAVDELNGVVKEMQELEEKKKANSDTTTRLAQIRKLLEAKSISPEEITKEILDAFIYRIIVIDKENIVFVINSTNKMDLETLRKERQKIVKYESIYENHLEVRDPIKLYKLNYKVVLA